MSISQALLPEFDHEVATTRKILDRLPEDKFGWKPSESSMAAGRLASHIAEMGGWGAVTMTSELFDIAPVGVETPAALNVSTHAELMGAFDKLMADTRKAIESASDADYMVNWTLAKGGVKILTMPRIAVMRSFVMNHIIHHRGQLSVYLRILGCKIPSIYGPSGDENVF